MYISNLGANAFLGLYISDLGNIVPLRYYNLVSGFLKKFGFGDA
jgi:hypothetical protein